MPIREQQTTNKQHAIPQSIMSVEFKIIGDLTLKQFFFLMIFCGLAYASFMLIPIFVIKWFLVAAFVLSGLAFAFLPLGDRGLDVWIVNFFRAMFMPNQFVYRKSENVPSFFLYQNLDVLKSELITLTPTSSRRKIEAYLEQQQTPFDKLDIDEKSYILMVKDAYSHQDYRPPVEVSSAATVTTTIEIPSKESLVQVVPGLEIKPPKPQQFLPQPANVPASTSVEQPKKSAQEDEKQNEQVIKSQASFKGYKASRKPQIQDDYYSPSITPDMHAGRRFINLIQEAGGGEITLPIRGERRLKSEEEQRFEAGEAQKIKELDDLINQIKSKELIQKQIIETQRAADRAGGSVQPQTNIAVEKQILENRSQEMEEKRLEEERTLAETHAREEAFKEQGRLEKLRAQEESIRRQKEELVKKQAQEEKGRQEAEIKAMRTANQPHPTPIQPAQIDESPTIPNIVWGIVTTDYQSKKVVVPGVVIVMRNQRGEVVRAVKTSSQGRFGITTPLINGSYTIEADKEKKSGLNFAVTAVEAKGDLIPTIEVVGKP